MDKQLDKKTATEVSEPTQMATPQQPAATHKPKDSRARTIAYVGGGVVILAIVFMLGWASNVNMLHRQGMQVMRGGFEDMHIAHPLRDSQTVNPTDGTTVSRLTGVVTQVGSDSFTIAGNGTTKTIKTTGSTVFNSADNKTVAVNDSVVVTGSDNNGTFTATNVRVLNVQN